MFKDRLLRGALAGVIASLCLIAWNLCSRYLLHFAKKTWLETLNYLVVGHLPKNFMDFVVAFGLLIIWNGLLGAIFVRVVIPERDGSYIGRAIGYGFITWFILYTIGTLYKVKPLTEIAWQTAISNWVAVTIFGIILGWLTKRWDKLEVEKREVR